MDSPGERGPLGGCSRAGLATLSGVLLGLSFPKLGHGAVAFAAVVPLLVAVAGASPRRAAGMGWLAGVVWGLVTLYWTAGVLVRHGGASPAVGAAALLLLASALALFPALFAWAVARWVAAAGPAALLGAPVAWVATEVLRAHTLFRFPWLLLGDSQHDHLPLLQLAAWAAVYGVSFLVAAVSAALAYAAVERRRGRRLAALGAALALPLAAWAHGSRVLSRPLPEGPRLRVGLVQASIPQEEKWDPARAEAHIARHLELSRRAAARGARLVVWPESAVALDLDLAPALAARLRAFARSEGVHLLFGNDDAEDADGGRRFYVGAKMLTPEGSVALRYRKRRLVPFGEYVPLRGLLHRAGLLLPKLVRQAADFTPGDRPLVGEAPGGSVGATICYEAIFPDLSRSLVRGGAELLVNVTNDAWYGRSSAPWQHLAMARLRAVETGRYLVRAANTGITAVVDPRGRILARSGLFEPAVLVEDVALLDEPTLYTSYGDLFAGACLVLAALATAATFRRRLPQPPLAIARAAALAAVLAVAAGSGAAPASPRRGEWPAREPSGPSAREVRAGPEGGQRGSGDAAGFWPQWRGPLGTGVVDAMTGADAPGALRLGGIGNVYASPVAAAGRVYVTDLDGNTMVLSAGPRPQVLALNRLDDRFSAAAAVAGRELYLRGERHLYSLTPL